MPPGDIPWDLKSYAESRLLKRDINELRELCTARDLMPGPTKAACVKLLLEWKEQLKEGGATPPPPGAAPRKPSPPPPAELHPPEDAAQREAFQMLLDATAADEKGDSDGAIDLYEKGCRQLMECIKGAESKDRKDTLRKQLVQALERAEQLKVRRLPQQAQPGRDRRAPRSVVATFQQHDYGHWRARLNELVRDDVHGHCDALSTKQRGNGAYTLRPLGGKAHSSDAPEVDHVFECQAMGDVLFRVEALRPALANVDWGTFQKGCSPDKHFKSQPMAVQNALAHARDVHNRSEHLVLCGSLVNKKKQGAFQTSLNLLAKGNALDHPLEEAIRLNCVKGKEPFEPDDASKIAKTVVSYLRDLEDPLTAAMRDVPRGTAQGGDQQARYDGVADEIVQLYENFEITRRV